jgi:hypothetical protein
MPDNSLIASIQTDMREIREDTQDAAVQLGTINTRLNTIFDYMRTCEARSDAHEVRITATENTQKVQERNLKFIGRFISWLWAIFLAICGFIAWYVGVRHV